MNERDTQSDVLDDDLSHLLHDHFSAELDQHVGRAAERFSMAISPVDIAPKRASGFSTAAWWAAPVIAAAAVVALFAAPQLRTVAPVNSNSNNGVALNSVVPNTNDTSLPVSANREVEFEPQDVTGRVTWATRDEGQVWLDDETPARKFRKRQYETLQYTDPRDSSRIEVTVPRDEIILVSSPRI